MEEVCPLSCKPPRFAGSRDTHVIVWDPATATPLATLEGHTYQVGIQQLNIKSSSMHVQNSLTPPLCHYRNFRIVETLRGIE